MGRRHVQWIEATARAARQGGKSGFNRRRGASTLGLCAVLVRWLLIAVLPVCALPIGAFPARASEPATLCDAAALRAAQASGVPVDLLRAIARAESGRTTAGIFAPWPWTTNIGGTGRYFDSRAEAEAHVRSQMAVGIRSIDIGCFQVNLHWHGDHFPSAEAMFDPDANARYAARFLTSLHAEFGDWTLASGAYHSRTPDRRTHYAARVAALRGRLSQAAEPPAGSEVAAAPHREPAAPAPLFAGGAGRMGSLVPRAETPAGGLSLVASRGGSLAASRAEPLFVTAAEPILRDPGLGAPGGAGLAPTPAQSGAAGIWATP